MNEEISVTLRNNTNQIQPVTLFTEQFSIPQNLVGGSDNVYVWNLSGESYFFSFASAVANIQVSTTPVTNLTPTTTTGVLPTNDINGLVSALNLLGVGTFTNIGSNIITITSSNYFFGSISLSASIYTSVTSNSPNIPPAIQVFVNANLILTIPSGISLNVPTIGVNAGDAVIVNYSIGAGTTWNFRIRNYVPPFPTFSNLINQAGAGAFSNSFPFTYPSTGNMEINLAIVP